MNGRKAKKKVPYYVPILWAITTVMWIAVVCLNSTDADFSPFWFTLQCATAILSGAAAVVNYIKYKRSNDDS